MKSTRYQRVLDNRNEICYERLSEASDQRQLSRFSIRAVFSGIETFVIGSRTINLYPGNFLVINEGTLYSRFVNSSIPVISFSVHYDAGYIDKFIRDLKRRKDGSLFMPYKTEENRDIILIDSIYHLRGDMECNLMHLKKHADRGMDDQFMINQYLHHLLLNYCQIYNEELYRKAFQLNMSAKIETKMDVLRRITMAKDFIISNHERNISLQDISGIACLSVSHLIRLFRIIFNRSPYQFLTHVRLERAKYYLANTRISIQEIVSLVGFENPSSFIRLFRNAYHTTPGTFRQHALN
jgi:AraC family transcriptional regulator